MTHTLLQRVRALRPELRRAHDALEAYAREIGATGPTLGIHYGDELGVIYKRGQRTILRMDPKPFKGHGWLCVYVGLPKDRVYSSLDRHRKSGIVRVRPRFESQSTRFDVLDWDDELVEQTKKLIAVACNEARAI